MEMGRILLADDEPTFATSTAELLRLEGYACETVSNGEDALQRVRQESFDLLIADLEMPGNANLALVRQIASESGGLPVIVITGYPSVRSAVACIELPVSAYLTKPPDIPELLAKVKSSVTRFRSYQAMQRIEQRLAASRQEYTELAAVRELAGAGAGADVFLSLTLRNVMGSLTDLQEIGRALAGNPVECHACTLLNCPRGAQLRNAVQRTVDVLEETRRSFKSKELAELRRQLELLLATN
ncbi:MAG: Regulator of RpoS [Gemmatimonadaceae bacterium]|nr:Regulator of RpoS [Gemmatimonadaceae bacterium]